MDTLFGSLDAAKEKSERAAVVFPETAGESALSRVVC